MATGARTRFAAAHGPVPEARREASAFDRSVHGISWILIRFMLLTPPLVLMANAALRGRGLETLPFAVAVAVGLTPEMLPVIVTTCLARGASLLARDHGVIVKRLPALHDLGAVDVLCLDKTGTLTQDRPVLAPRPRPAAAGRSRGAALGRGQRLVDPPARRPARPGRPRRGDPGRRRRGRRHGVRRGGGRCPSIRYGASRPPSCARPGRLGTHTLVVKGAAEAVLERCALADGRSARPAAGARRAGGATTGCGSWPSPPPSGPRARRDYTPGRRTRPGPSGGSSPSSDALAPTAADALEALADRGVAVKILTGDHPGTAARACRDLGVPVPADAVLAADRIDGLTDAELAEVAARTTVFARCAPEHKARIVSALRAGGHTVGFLATASTTCPPCAPPTSASHRATPWTSPGRARTWSSPRRTSPRSTTAIAAGRHSSGNIATYLRITLSSNLGNVIAMLAAGLLLPFLPMLPAQVLVQNLCFDAAQLAFAYDRPHPSVLRRPTVLRPRDLLRFITGFGALNAVADLATFGVLALALHGSDGLDDAAVFHSGWFTENLLTQAPGDAAAARRDAGAAHGRGPGPIGWAAAALAAVGLLLPVSPLGSLLGFTPLPPLYYLLLAAVLALYTIGLLAVRGCSRLYSCAM